MHKIFDWLIEVIGWLRIVASPLIIGLIIGAIVYFANPTTTRLVIGISIAFLGLIIGIIWATRIWKTKEGTMFYISKVMETPDLDKKNQSANDHHSENKKGSL